MDGQRFDDLARVVARSASRRQVLRGLLGGTVGGALVAAGLARPGARTALAQDSCAAGGDSCSTGDDCCSGKCNSDGLCYCTDPDRPGVGCDCTTGTESPCGDTTLLCCATTDTPGGPGVCTPSSVGCNPTGGGGEGDPCTTGTENPCGDTTLLCCPTTSNAGGPGICTSASTGCNPTGNCAGAGDPCDNDGQCCAGKCSDQGICYCTDPARPALGCPCTTGTDNACGGGTLLCCGTTSTPGGPGICTSSSVGCNPTGNCADPGGSCTSDGDCCEGQCSSGGICYCTDPARPQLGCSCTTGTQNACGGGTLLCCGTTSTPGGPGICTSASVGCNPTGGGGEGDPCTTGTQSPCNDGLKCCPTTSRAGGPGVCTASSQTCPAVLPDTGTGQSAVAGSSGLWKPVALLGAGAAVIAHRLRRSRDAR